MIDKDRMDTVECAEYIGVSRSTIYTMVRKKEIPHWRARTQIMFSQKVIDDWKLKQQQEVLTGS
jgi:excisionase family DNA binding protein